MRKDRYTAITEFEVIAPTNEIEIVGEKLKLSDVGNFYSDNSTHAYNEYNLLFLLDHPAHYRVSKITMEGVSYDIPADREKNYSPKSHPSTMKYYKGNNNN